MSTIQLTRKIDVSDDNGNTIQLAKLAITAGFNEWDITSLINSVIRPNHFNTKKDIVIIYDLAQKVFTKYGEKHPELAKLVEALFLFFNDLSFHLKKEEQILFPNIMQLNQKKSTEGYINYSTFGMIKQLASAMQKEHQAVVKQLDLIRQITNNYLIPPNCSAAYRYLLKRMNQFETNLLEHINLENNILFPRAVRMDETYLEKESN